MITSNQVNICIASILIVDIEHNDEKSIKHILDGAAADVDRYFINSL